MFDRLATPAILEITLPRIYDPVLTTKEKSLIKLEGEVEALNKQLVDLKACKEAAHTYEDVCAVAKQIAELKKIRAQKNLEIWNTW